MQFKPDTEVEFHVKAKFDTDVEAEFDRNNENDTQEATVTAEFDEDVDFMKSTIARVAYITQELHSILNIKIGCNTLVFT